MFYYAKAKKNMNCKYNSFPLCSSCSTVRIWVDPTTVVMPLLIYALGNICASGQIQQWDMLVLRHKDEHCSISV